MGDVIIAIVPAPGHEGLVADGPCGERPPLLIRWRAEHVDKRDANPWLLNDSNEWPDYFERALVLYAPGGPRLGMVRLAEALGGPINANYVSDVTEIGWAAWVGDEWYDGKYLPLPDPPNGQCVEEFGGAHLAVQRGLASEVLVLPVTP